MSRKFLTDNHYKRFTDQSGLSVVPEGCHIVFPVVYNQHQIFHPNEKINSLNLSEKRKPLNQGKTNGNGRSRYRDLNPTGD